MATVHRLKIHNVQRTGAPTSVGNDYTIGHSFDVVIELTDIDNCTLKWFEKASVSYKPAVFQEIGGRRVETDPGMPVDKWTDMYKLEPESPIFKPWNDAKGKSGRQTITITDIPGILRSKTRERRIDFCIEVVPDVGNKRVATACQMLDFAGRDWFQVWINNTIRPPD